MQKPPTFMQRKRKKYDKEQVWRKAPQYLRNQMRRGFQEGGQQKQMIQGNTVKTEIKKYVDLTIRKLLLVFIKVMKLETNKSLNHRQLGLSLWGGCIVLLFELAAVARASPGTWSGRGAHREPPVKVSSAPRQEWGEPWRRGSGFRWGGGGGRSQLCSPGSPLRLGRQRERGRGGVRSRLGSAPGGGGGGLPSCALGGRHCGWARPFRALLGAQGSASSGRSGGVRTTGQGTGTAWSREPRIPPSVGTFLELPHLAVAERPRLWGQGLYRSTPLLKNLRVCAGFPSSLGSAGSPRDRTLNLGWLAQPCFWHFVGQRALEHLL